VRRSKNIIVYVKWSCWQLYSNHKNEYNMFFPIWCSLLVFSFALIHFFPSLSPCLSSKFLCNEFCYPPMNVKRQCIFKTSQTEFLNKRETRLSFIASTATSSCKHPHYDTKLLKANLYLLRRVHAEWRPIFVLWYQWRNFNNVGGYFNCLLFFKDILSYT